MITFSDMLLKKTDKHYVTLRNLTAVTSVGAIMMGIVATIWRLDLQIDYFIYGAGYVYAVVLLALFATSRDNQKLRKFETFVMINSKQIDLIHTHQQQRILEKIDELDKMTTIRFATVLEDVMTKITNYLNENNK